MIHTDRLTKTIDCNKHYIVEDDKIEHIKDGFSGEAINKLAKFENVYDDLKSKQIELSKELESLRLEGKTRTVKFKQLLVNKLNNNNIILLFESYEIK